MHSRWLGGARSLQRRIAIGSVLVLTMIVATVIPLTNYTAREDALKVLGSRLSADVDADADTIRANVERLNSDIRFLSSTPPIQGIVRAARSAGYDAQEQSTEAIWKQRLAEIFAAYLRTHSNAWQVRYIGVADDGMELVRVERLEDTIVSVPAPSLQSKGDRDYFDATLRRGRDQIYLSDINLNREFGEVETPHRPTLRVAVPVIAEDGSRFGMVVINQDMSARLAFIHQSSPDGTNIYLLNADGEFLVHPDTAKTFGFDLGQPYGWADEFAPAGQPGPPRGSGTGLQVSNNALTSYDGPTGLVHVATRRVVYDDARDNGYVTIAVAAGDKVVQAAVIHARERVILELAALALIASIFLYLIVLAVARREIANQQEAELAAIVSGSEDAIIGMTLRGVATSWNNAAEKLFGFEAREALGQPVAQLIVPEDRKAEEIVIRSSIARGKAINAYDSVRRRRDGSIVDVSVSVSPVYGPDGSVVAAAKFIRDISERKAAEARVKEWNESLEQLVSERTMQLEEAGSLQRGILAAAGYAIIAADTNGVITLFNPAAEAMLGYSAAEMINKSTAEAFLDKHEVVNRARQLTEEMGFTVEPGIEAVVAKARLQIPDEDEWTYIHKDGSRFPVLLNLSSLRSQNGQLTGFLGIAIDRTESKRQEQELVRAKETADAASEAKGTFLANMSHEIRTPMNAVLGMIQLLQRTELSERQNDYVARAHSAARSLLDLINDILDVSKIEAGKLALESEPFVIDELLRELATILGVTAGAKQVEILYEVDSTVPRMVSGDALRLKQVLVNLAGNAVKFTEHGEVSIGISVAEERDDDVLLTFSVTDTGIGISEAQRARIFDAFTQAEAGTTRRYGGTGLGLVICRRLVLLMGGELTLESEPGVGSTFAFTIRLQLVGQTREMQSRVAAAATYPDLRNLRLLIVDDNEKARKIAADMAHSLGWNTDVCASGVEAVRYIGDSTAADRPYNVVLLDWQMPELNGWDTAQRMRAMPGGDVLPIIIMLSANDREDLAAKVDAEPELTNGLLMKPFAASDLLDAIASSLHARGGTHRHDKAQTFIGRRLDGMRVLVVEDNLTNQMVARELLSAESAAVEVAGGGLVALDMLDEDPDRCDVVLMDVQMPDLDGYEATRQIRNKLNLHKLPIIAMTANTMQTDREAALESGMNEHIGKPFELEQVVATLLAHTGRAAAAASAVPGICAAIEEPAGFDLGPALRRLGGNTMLYARQARRFTAQFGTDGAAVRDMLNRGDHDAAARRLHTLRGVAATLGAEALATQAAAIEADIKANVAKRQLAAGAERLATLIHEAGETLQRVAGRLDAVQPETGNDIVATTDVTPLMTSLALLLDDANMRAVDVYAELRPMLAGYPEEILTSLDAAFDSLDFRSALQTLRTMEVRDVSVGQEFVAR